MLQIVDLPVTELFAYWSSV